MEPPPLLLTRYTKSGTGPLQVAWFLVDQLIAGTFKGLVRLVQRIRRSSDTGGRPLLVSLHSYSEPTTEIDIWRRASGRPSFARSAITPGSSTGQLRRTDDADVVHAGRD